MSIHRAIHAEPFTSLLVDARKTVDDLTGFRRWTDIRAIEALILHATISNALAIAAQSEADCWRAACHDHELSTLSIGEARTMLSANGVPECAFFDDFVRNAVIQRNQMGDLVEKVLTWAKTIAHCPEDSEIDTFTQEMRLKCAELGYVRKDTQRQPEGQAPDDQGDPGPA